jgi:hypothetical protein
MPSANNLILLSRVPRVSVLAATWVMREAGLLGPGGLGPGMAAAQIPATVRADVSQLVLDAISTERALVAAYACVQSLGRQIDVAQLAVRA